MPRIDAVKADSGDWPVRNPWPLLVAGLAAGVLALLLPAWSGTVGILVRVLLILAGLLCAGGAVSLRLYFAGQDVDDRAKSAGLLALAALVPLLCYAAADKDWDTFRLVLTVLTVVAVVGAVLVLLPTVARRVAVSLLLLFHFAGILTAVTSVSPPGADPPWLVSQAWIRVFRPYLQFAYLNNAYHFYSPEPGPPELLWFHIEYADGTSRWEEMPKREQFQTRQEYQRRLALTESVNMLMPNPPALPEELKQRRLVAATAYQIPVYPGLSETFQYREPQAYSKKMISAYARHAARNYPNPDNPGVAVEGVKVYRVVHNMLSAEQMDEGYRPLDPTFYAPYYQGEFDKDGNLKDPTDPFLYWLIPIMWVPKDRAQPRMIPIDRKPNPEEFEIVDFTKVHANIKTRKPGS
jgi:hypothetical protein